MHSRTMLVAACFLALAAPAARAQEGALPDSSPPRAVRLAAPLSVPWLSGSIPVVETWIDGRGPFRFGIETGARMSIIRPGLADSLGLAARRDLGDGREVWVDSLRIGGSRFDGVPFFTMRVAQPGIDGIIGLPVYSGVLLIVDYPGRTVSFASDTLPAADGREVLALSRVGPFWGLPLGIGGRVLTGVLDTRSTGGFGFTSADGLAFDGPLAVIGMARGAAIAPTEVRGGVLRDDITIGRHVFAQPFVVVRPLPPGFPTEPVVGTQVLSRFTLALDQRTGRLRLARSGSDPIALPRPTPR